MAWNAPKPTPATLADLRRVTPWLCFICARCLRRTPTALAAWIIRWGADASSDMLGALGREPRAELHCVPAWRMLILICCERSWCWNALVLAFTISNVFDDF